MAAPTTILDDLELVLELATAHADTAQRYFDAGYLGSAAVELRTAQALKQVAAAVIDRELAR